MPEAGERPEEMKKDEAISKCYAKAEDYSDIIIRILKLNGWKTVLLIVVVSSVFFLI